MKKLKACRRRRHSAEGASPVTCGLPRIVQQEEPGPEHDRAGPLCAPRRFEADPAQTQSRAPRPLRLSSRVGSRTSGRGDHDASASAHPAAADHGPSFTSAARSARAQALADEGHDAVDGQTLQEHGAGRQKERGFLSTGRWQRASPTWRLA